MKWKRKVMVNYSRAAVSLKTLFQFPLLADYTSMLLLTLRLSGKLRDKRLLVENFTKQQQQQVTKVEQFIVNTTKRRNKKIWPQKFSQLRSRSISTIVEQQQEIKENKHFKIQPFFLVAKLRLKIPGDLVDDRDKDICWSFVQKTASIEAQVTKIGKFLGAGGICALHRERSSRKFTQFEIFLFKFSEWIRKHYRRNFCQCSRKISCYAK